MIEFILLPLLAIFGVTWFMGVFDGAPKEKKRKHSFIFRSDKNGTCRGCYIFSYTVVVDD